MDITNGIVVDAFNRIRDVLTETVDGLSVDDLTFRPIDSANSIAWLIWHLTRVQDEHVSDLASKEQVWVKDWYEKFDLPFEKHDTGYGHSSGDVAKVRSNAKLLIGYFDAVHQETTNYIRKLVEQDYKKIVDRHWDPPVTQPVRLVSILSDDLQHAGQAAYVRGLLKKHL